MRQHLKRILEMVVDAYAHVMHVSFPKKYTWRWKLEMLTGRYEPETFVLFERLIKPGMTVIDIGAHIGYFTHLFANRVGKSGRVIAFEADPTNFDLLTNNTKRFTNITREPLAISDKKGTLDFYESTTNTGFHSLIASEERTTHLHVTATTLDTYLTSHVIHQVDVIKMDIEGAEPLAIAGMTHLFSSEQPPAMVFEFCEDHLKTANVDISSFFQHLQNDLHLSLFIITQDNLVSCKSIEDIRTNGRATVNLLAIPKQGEERFHHVFDAEPF